MKSLAALLRTSGQPLPYEKTRPLDLVEIDLEKPGEGEVLVKITAAGICHSDLSVVNGSRPRPTPLIGGHEGAGIVEEVGAGVKDLKPGDAVSIVFLPSCGECEQCREGVPAFCSVGSAANVKGELIRGGSRISYKGERIHHYNGVSCYSQYMVLDRRSLIQVPSDLPIEIAAIFGCAFLTGVGAVRNGAKVPAGASVGVWGLGGVGMAALLGAVVAKASPIIAIDPVPMKRALALELGADIAIDPNEDIREHIKGGVEFAIEAVGKASALKLAYESTARAGTTVTVGLPAPSDQLSFSAVSLVTDVKTLKGSYLGSGDPRKDIPDFVQLWRDGKLPADKLITKTRPLTEVNESMDELDDAQKVIRQIVQPH